jgi:hypothetical protein
VDAENKQRIIDEYLGDSPIKTKTTGTAVALNIYPDTAIKPKEYQMSPATTTSAGATLTLNEEERSQLLSLLEQTLRDTHVEARRTEAPVYQEQVHHQEAIWRGLIDKLRRR